MIASVESHPLGQMKPIDRLLNDSVRRLYLTEQHSFIPLHGEPKALLKYGTGAPTSYPFAGIILVDSLQRTAITFIPNDAH